MAEPLDPYIEQYMAPADLDDYHPLYKELMNYGGQRYGLFDDGDMIILYYRTDLFEDPANKDAFKAQYGHELAAPKDWTEYDEIQAFFTEQGGGNSWGGASQREPGQVYGWFSEEFRNRGGRFFDDETLDATLDSQAGVDTLTRMIESNKTMPPGIETWDFVEVLSRLDGRTARDDRRYLAADRPLVGGDDRRAAELGAGDPGQGQGRLFGHADGAQPAQRWVLAGAFQRIARTRKRRTSSSSG